MCVEVNIDEGHLLEDKRNVRIITSNYLSLSGATSKVKSVNFASQVSRLNSLGVPCKSSTRCNSSLPIVASSIAKAANLNVAKSTMPGD